MTAINPTDLASIAQIATDLNNAIYPDGESPAIEGVYVKVTGIEVWSEVENRRLGTLVEYEGMYLQFLPATDPLSGMFGSNPGQFPGGLTR
jgi:hypothetical protein